MMRKNYTLSIEAELKQVYEIDGKKFSTLEGFANEFSMAI
jgi:hypothetical protein